MEFAEKLKRLCALNGISGRRLAAILGDISRSKAGDWLRGKYVPDIEEAVRLADHFGVSVEYLARDEIEEIDADGLSDDERIILDVYRALPYGKTEALRRLYAPPVEPAYVKGRSHAQEQADHPLKGKGPSLADEQIITQKKGKRPRKGKAGA